MKNVVSIFWNISLHQVFWLKDNVEINTKDGYYIVSNTGDLLISQTQLRDMGNYTCGAKNLAARRLSESASLIVYGKVSTPTTPVIKCPHTHTLIKEEKKVIDFGDFAFSLIWKGAVLLHIAFLTFDKRYFHDLDKNFVWPWERYIYIYLASFLSYLFNFAHWYLSCWIWFVWAPLPLDISVSPVWGSAEEMDG